MFPLGIPKIVNFFKWAELDFDRTIPNYSIFCETPTSQFCFDLNVTSKNAKSAKYKTLLKLQLPN